MKTRTIFAAAALCTVIFGIWCFVRHSQNARQAAVATSMEMARHIMGPVAKDFKLSNVRFFDSSASDKFYVALEFSGLRTGDKLQQVFYFDAFSGKPQMLWSYSVFNNLAKLKVNGGAFVDDGNSQIHKNGKDFEMKIALTPVAWQFQGETISRLGREGVELLISLEGHPELKPFRITTVTEAGCTAAFSSMEDAFNCAKILGIKIKD